MTEHKRPTIPKTLRMLVWDKYIGLDQGSTQCLCGTKIYQLNFECGHVVPFSYGGETNVKNLRPICASCNKSMGNTNYFDFVKKIGLSTEEDYDFVIVSKIIESSEIWKHIDLFHFVKKSSVNVTVIVSRSVGRKIIDLVVKFSSYWKS